MQFLALDKQFAPVGYLAPLNVQWTREYYTIGQFSLLVAADGYTPDMAYLYRTDRVETGIIQKVQLTESIKGRFVQLSGYFLEAILNDKAVWPTYYASGSLPAAVAEMLRRYKGDIPLLEVANPPAALSADAWQETGGGLAAVAYIRLQTVEMSLRCRYDYLAGRIIAEVWQGLDRTQDQTENPFVMFSDTWRNLAQADLTLDQSNWKNYAIVAGEGEGSARKVAYADLSKGGYRRILFIDARSERWDPDKQSEAQYLESLRQKGLDTLLDYQPIRNLEIDATQTGFTYLADWDLGDKVDVAMPDAGLVMQGRIVTVREVMKNNTFSVNITLGDKKLTQLKKARMIY